MRILLVENHPDTMSFIARHLRRTGHQVTTARNCEDAIAALQAEMPDVLLADIGLPDGDGWELLAGLGEKRPPLAIAISGRGTPADCARSLEAGYALHLPKPFLPEELDSALQEGAKLLGKG